MSWEKQLPRNRNAKALLNLTGFENAKNLEDPTPLRVQFFNIKQTDSIVSSAWTREGTIFDVWKEETEIYI